MEKGKNLLIFLFGPPVRPKSAQRAWPAASRIPSASPRRPTVLLLPQRSPSAISAVGGDPTPTAAHNPRLV